jgi:hypothetical protein
VTESLLLALGVALSPLPLLAILLFLAGNRPRVTATAFWLAWANPKNLALILGAAVLMVDTTSGSRELTVTAGAFVVIAASGVSLPLAAHSAFPERVEPRLLGLRGAFVRRGRLIAMVLGFGIDALFVTEWIRAL